MVFQLKETEINYYSKGDWDYIPFSHIHILIASGCLICPHTSVLQSNRNISVDATVLSDHALIAKHEPTSCQVLTVFPSRSLWQPCGNHNKAQQSVVKHGKEHASIVNHNRFVTGKFLSNCALFHTRS